MNKKKIQVTLHHQGKERNITCLISLRRKVQWSMVSGAELNKRTRSRGVMGTGANSAFSLGHWTLVLKQHWTLVLKSLELPGQHLQTSALVRQGIFHTWSGTSNALSCQKTILRLTLSALYQNSLFQRSRMRTSPLTHRMVLKWMVVVWNGKNPSICICVRLESVKTNRNDRWRK